MTTPVPVKEWIGVSDIEESFMIRAQHNLTDSDVDGIALIYEELTLALHDNAEAKHPEVMLRLNYKTHGDSDLMPSGYNVDLTLPVSVIKVEEDGIKLNLKAFKEVVKVSHAAGKFS